MLVQTIKGDIDISELKVYDRIWFENGARNIHTRWFLGDELVREDGVVQVLRAQDLSSAQPTI